MNQTEMLVGDPDDFPNPLRRWRCTIVLGTEPLERSGRFHIGNATTRRDPYAAATVLKWTPWYCPAGHRRDLANSLACARRAARHSYCFACGRPSSPVLPSLKPLPVPSQTLPSWAARTPPTLRRDPAGLEIVGTPLSRGSGRGPPPVATQMLASRSSKSAVTLLPDRPSGGRTYRFLPGGGAPGPGQGSHPQAPSRSRSRLCASI